MSLVFALDLWPSVPFVLGSSFVCFMGGVPVLVVCVGAFGVVCLGGFAYFLVLFGFVGSLAPRWSLGPLLFGLAGWVGLWLVFFGGMSVVC